jgi:hypothetical protein
MVKRQSEAKRLRKTSGPFTSPIKPAGENIYDIKYCGVR